jgi:hypothetical protein
MFAAYVYMGVRDTMLEREKSRNGGVSSSLTRNPYSEVRWFVPGRRELISHPESLLRSEVVRTGAA